MTNEEEFQNVAIAFFKLCDLMRDVMSPALQQDDNAGRYTSKITSSSSVVQAQ